jgi:hypothetical protein
VLKRHQFRQTSSSSHDRYGTDRSDTVARRCSSSICSASCARRQRALTLTRWQHYQFSIPLEFPPRLLYQRALFTAVNCWRLFDNTDPPPCVLKLMPLPFLTTSHSVLCISLWSVLFGTISVQNNTSSICHQDRAPY